MAKVAGMVCMILLFCVAGDGFTAAEGQFVDPMRPSLYQNQANKRSVTEEQVQVSTAGWELTAVLLSPGRSVAVINGKSLQVGEQLEGYRLIQIQSDRVTLRNKQGKLVLRRAGTGLKKVSVNRGIGKGSKP
ncbi:MAG: hypothetical protein V2I50_04140 [Desulfuromusa sp.]|nr:hypothetical protein [Desulfuromusa sp.]